MRLILPLALTSACILLAPAQVVRIAGRIPCAADLQVVGSRSPGRVRLDSTNGGEIPVTFTLRTNCAYKIQAELTGRLDLIVQPVKIEPQEVVPAAGQGNLMANALAVVSSGAEISPGRPAVWMEGPRVSKGGNNSTADNAILIRAVIQVLPGVRDVDAVFKLVFQ
jgi:hypothetical protein